MLSLSYVYPARPAPALLSASVRRPVADVEAIILGATSPGRIDEVLPNYAEARRTQPPAPPGYRPFSTAKQAFWHLSGVPRAAGFVAGLVPLAAGAGGAATLYRASLAQAVQTCMQAVTLDPYLCEWAFDDYSLGAAQCQALCATKSSTILSQGFVQSSTFADPIFRSALTGGIVLGSAAAAIGAAVVGAQLADKFLRYRRPDVVAARRNYVEGNIAMQELGDV